MFTAFNELPVVSSLSDMNKVYVFLLFLLVAVAVYVPPTSQILYALPLLLLSSNVRRKIRIAVKTAPRDLDLALKMVKVFYWTRQWEKGNFNLTKAFADRVALHPNKVALIHEDKSWTFSEVNLYSNQVANYFKSRGLVKGDVVGLLMEGRPQYIVVWLGLAKIGVITALINSNLRGHALKYSIEVSKCKKLVYGTELAQAVEEIQTDLELLGSGPGTKLVDGKDLDQELLEVATSSPPQDAVIRFKDKALYIFTSGTTGLPKAAVITHARALFMTCGLYRMTGLRSDDVIYTPLPLYHTAGGILGAGQMVASGLTVVIRSKFSASNFWPDCIKYKCTVGQYIGETCRYMLSQPERPTDKTHKVRLMYGNGLRAQIWPTFVERFGVKDIAEFYGATEGIANLMNVWNHVGAVGYLPWFAKPLYTVTLLKVDPYTKEPLRDSRNRCILAETGEPGLLVGRIDPTREGSNFTGYSDSSATAKKILRDVLKAGDAFFNSGDILMRDELGYFYFKDRTGDTFRWRGENVATSEVEAIISNIIGLKDCVVYGVEVADCEGRAGMAAILDPEGSLNLETLEKGINKALSSYARPLFIRVLKTLPLTGTFKLKKVELTKEGYDVREFKDRVYFLDPSSRKYKPLTPELYDEIREGKIRF